MTDDHPVPQVDAGDVQALAREMATAYKRAVAAYREQLQLSAEEAHARAVEPPQPAWRSMISSQPELARWGDLSALTERAPEAAAALWQHLTERARDELASGQRAATAVGFDARPWDRARFLAVRDALLDEHPGAAGASLLLIDTAAQAYTLYLEVIDSFYTRTHTETMLEQAQIRSRQRSSQSVPGADTIQRAADMAEQWHRVFLRAIRQLQDMRRAPALVVQNHGQVNIGQEQTNLATGRPCGRRRRRRAE
jgi:hypothetical protein